MHAYVYTPRRTNVLFPRSKPKHTFSPTVNEPYVAPPPPPPLKRAVAPQASHVSAGELEELAAGLQAEADELEQTAADSSGPPLGIQLGLLLMTREDYIKKILKEWDSKGKGEVLKGEL